MNETIIKWGNTTFNIGSIHKLLIEKREYNKVLDSLLQLKPKCNEIIAILSKVKYGKSFTEKEASDLFNKVKFEKDTIIADINYLRSVSEYSINSLFKEIFKSPIEANNFLWNTKQYVEHINNFTNKYISICRALLGENISDKMTNELHYESSWDILPQYGISGKNISSVLATIESYNNKLVFLKDTRNKYLEIIEDIFLETYNTDFIKNLKNHPPKDHFNSRHRKFESDVITAEDEFLTLIKSIDAESIRLKELSELENISQKETATDSSSIEKIIWLKNKQDFIALFDKLMALGYIAYKKNRNEMLTKHFTWQDGEMTAEQLKHLKSNINNKPETYQLSDEMKIIIDQLKNDK